ncbi:MAG: hypothetical protein ACJA01_003840 [Saprospiraceae bacterium]
MITSQDISLYESYVQRHRLPVFFQPWYLDAVCRDGQWHVSMDIHEGEVRGVWPYFLKRKYGQHYITQPPLTSFLGPYCHRPEDMTKESTWISHQKAVLTNLFDQLPAHLLMISQWTPDQTNWLPLYWKGCKQTTRYTYQIELEQNIEKLWSSITDKQRNRIRNAEKAYKISDTEELNDLWTLIETTYNRQGQTIPYSRTLLSQFDTVLQKHQMRKIFLVKSNAMTVAGLYLIYDNFSAYMIITGRSDEDKDGGVALAIWEAIQFSKKQGLTIFDFEGSMMLKLEKFFRSFGGNMVPYHRVTHTTGKFSEIIFRALNRI